MQLSRGFYRALPQKELVNDLKAPAVLCRGSSKHNSSILIIKNVLPQDFRVAPVSKSACRNFFKEDLMYDTSRGGSGLRDLRPFPLVNIMFHYRDLSSNKDFFW